MSSLFDQLSQHVNADTIGQIANQIGATPGQTQAAVSAAMPMLLGALARNSATPQGAAGILGALERDHDGSLLDSLGGLFGSAGGAGGLSEIGGMLGGLLGGGSAGVGSGGGGMMDMGGAILGHVFGGKQGNVAASLGKSTGLQSGQILQLLAMLAPIVMAVLGKQNKQSGGLDQGGLADILGGAFQKSAAQAPASVTQASGAGGIGDLLSSVLDANHDGSVMDDLMKQGGGILGSLLGGPKKG
ncbi:MAG: DUF937 domain-containing protein [Thermoanaerobaculia bacterium]|nr:DUF937 domain-containing protein [Thermoanaerobaculia bacterium]